MLNVIHSFKNNSLSKLRNGDNFLSEILSSVNLIDFKCYPVIKNLIYVYKKGVLQHTSDALYKRLFIVDQ